MNLGDVFLNAPPAARGCRQECQFLGEGARAASTVALAAGPGVCVAQHRFVGLSLGARFFSMGG